MGFQFVNSQSTQVILTVSKQSALENYKFFSTVNRKPCIKL